MTPNQSLPEKKFNLFKDYDTAEERNCIILLTFQHMMIMKSLIASLFRGNSEPLSESD